MAKDKESAFDKLLREHPERLDAYDAQTDASRSSPGMDEAVRADIERLKKEREPKE